MTACRRAAWGVATALLSGFVALAPLRAVAADATVLSDINYRVGEGLHVPALGLNLGGYATGAYSHLRDRESRVSLDNLSLSLWWEGTGRWRAFSEFDSENTLATRSSADRDERRYLALERMYVDYAINEQTTFRIGKFLTPIGRWNLVHAAPLVWTTSRPLATSLAFPTNVTGLMLSGNLAPGGTSVDYILYGSTGNEVLPNPSLDTFSEAIGTRLVATLSTGWQLGFSYVSFEQSGAPEQRRQIVGMDVLWSYHGVEVSGEALHRSMGRADERDERGGFVQAALPLTPELHAVGRLESYRESGQPHSTMLWVSGLSYRLTPAVLVKAEWIGSRNSVPGTQTGFLSSVSLLF